MKRTFTQILSALLVLFTMQTMTAQEQILTVNAPSNITAIYEMGEGSFPDWQGALMVGETITGDLAYVEANVMDGDEYDDDTPVMGCVELSNMDEVAGKIALVQRGACTFSQKVDAAQNAGAIAVVICNNRPVSEDGGGIVNLAASDPWAGTDTIPVGFLSQEDCADIRMELDAGTNVNITIGVKEFVDVSAAYTYRTPQDNIVPMTGIGATIFAVETAEVTITWVITDPNGVETTLETSGEAADVATAANGTRFSVDEPYLPEAVGVYNVVCTNTLNEEVLTTAFEITEGENIFALDDGEIDDFVGIAGGDSWTAPATGTGSIFDANIVIRTGEQCVALETVEFGLQNWAEIQADAEGAVEFVFQIYDLDPDMDGTLADFPDGSDYSSLGVPLSFTIYTATGEEENNTTVSADFTALGEAPELAAGGAFLVSMQYRGESANNGIPPNYLTAGNTCYNEPFDGSIITSQWFNGFVGCPNIVIRPFAPKVISSVDNVLAETALAVAPNNVTDALNVAINLENSSDDVAIQIINITGQVMVNENMDNLRNADLTYDVANYPAGTYFIKVTTTEGYAVEKFVKH